MILVAGPLANLLSALAGIAVLNTFGDDLSRYASSALTLWTVINTFLGIVNLFSFSHRTTFGEQHSDGAQIRALPRKNDEEIDKVLRERNVILASLEYSFGDMDKSLLYIEKGFEHRDDSIIARSLLTATLAENGQLER